MSEIDTKEVIEIVSTHTGIEPDGIFVNSRIEQDLGCLGDYAAELLEEIRNRYNVDFSGIAVDDFVTPEVEGFIGYLFNRKQLNHRKAFPITVQHLIEVIKSGAWFEPPQVKKNLTSAGSRTFLSVRMVVRILKHLIRDPREET